MAAFQKFNQFTNDLMAKVHNLGSDALKVCLSNTQPVSTNTVLSNITQIAAANGYLAGGTATTPTLTTSSGVSKLVCSNVTFTASGGTMGTFQYVVLYNSTPGFGNLIGWYDNGAPVSLANTQTFTWTPDAVNGVLTVS